MQNPVIAITDKVMSMLKSMVYLSMCVYYRRGATAEEISSFLNEWAPDGDRRYHPGIVERVLRDLLNEGAVSRAGARWYATAHPG
jgi:hypothetical protein